MGLGCFQWAVATLVPDLGTFLSQTLVPIPTPPRIPSTPSTRLHLAPIAAQGCVWPVARRTAAPWQLPQ
jgi:hypothetical protein